METKNNQQNMNVVGRISHFFAVNRPLTILLLTVTLVFGLVAFLLTPKQYNPEIVRPAFQVTINYEGSTIDSALERVVYELVEKVDTVPGVDDIYTEVSDGATISTTVIFEVGYDATKAKLDLFSQLEQHSYLARGNITTPSIVEINPETIPVLQIAFGSNVLTSPAVRDKVIELSHTLNNVDDVSELKVYGGYAPTLVVEIDPLKLTKAGLTLNDVTSTIEESQTRAVLSGVRQESTVTEIVFDATATDAEAVGNLLVAPDTRLRDVAQIYAGAGQNRNYVFYQDNNQSGEVILLSVAKREGSSAPVVTTEVIVALNTALLKPEYTGLTYQVVSDDGQTAAKEIYGLTQNLITSIVIVAGVLLLFLSKRAALAVLVAIPVTLLLVFGFGLLFDQTINRITLFALILSLGLLVDSAIVVVENIYSHLKQWHLYPDGRSKAAVVASAVDEVGVGLLLSTVTSIIVFMPMNFITGMMGPYMGPIAFFVPAALILSLFVAIVITPFVTSHIIDMEEKPTRLAEFVSHHMNRVTNIYRRILGQILASRKQQRLLLRSALLLFIMSLVLPAFGLVHFQMLPRADRDQFYMYLDLPAGTDIEKTREATRNITDLALNHDEVVSVQESIGTAPIIDFNGMFKGVQGRTDAEQATVRINLTSVDDRSLSSTDIASFVRAEVAAKLPGLAPYVRFMEEPPGPPVRATLVAKVTAPENIRSETVSTIFSYVESVPGVVDVYTSEEDTVGRALLSFDYEAAAKLDVSPTSALHTLQLISDGVEAAELTNSSTSEYTPIVVNVPYEQRSSINVLDTVMITTSNGKSVPLSAVVNINYEARPSSVNLEDGMVLTYVTAEVEDRSIVYVMIELMHNLISSEQSELEVSDWGLFGMTLTTPTGEAITLSWGGEWEMTLENFRDLGIAMIVALFMVYAVLVAQYNRFDTPAYILVTVPLGLVGILWGFFILDTYFNVYLTATALIGFIALIGLVVNNAIIFLEYVEQSLDRGVSYLDALLAAGEARLRPILLTSLTTILGSLTIAADPVWSGLAWAIVFGLSLSTVLTLVIYPTLLAYYVHPKLNKYDQSQT